MGHSLNSSPTFSGFYNYFENDKSNLKKSRRVRPLSVIIINKPTQLTANEEITIQCQVTGSRPRAIVSWTRDNKEFRRGKVLEEGNETLLVSTITFVPVPEDDGSIFKCIGENPKLTDVALEDSFKLNVVYSPQVSLHLGNTLNPEEIKEGSDVYFECIIRSNPEQHKITWYHDESLVSQNMTSGIIISAQSLVLQRVTRWQSGAYTCLAANSMGETTSSPVILRVRYAPVCSKENEITVIGASLDETLKVKCRVSADPSDITFVWQFNNSGDGFDTYTARLITSSGNVSELTYTPTSQRDYGSLTCWGTNSIGRQVEPCVFQIVPAGKPSPLTNCTLKTVTNHTEIVEVECRAGYDGGLPQRFILEAYDALNMRMRLNFTVLDTETPVFRLDLSELLPSPLSLRILVYAENAKGRSEKLILEEIMLNDAEKRTDGRGSTNLVPLAGLLTGSLLTIGMAVLLIVVMAVRRKRDCDGHLHCPHHINIDASKHNLKSRQGSMLEINAGDSRYVVAYTLKPATDCNLALPPPSSLLSLVVDPRRQPDILNTPRGELCYRHQLNYDLSTHPSALESSPNGDSNTLQTTQPRSTDTLHSSFATMRRDNIITDVIPGPESCV